LRQRGSVRGELTAAHIGDSRLYLCREGRLLQLTKDHTVAGERARMGLMSKSRARSHPGKSVLTRSLGRELIVPIDRISNHLFRDDTLLVCSDGLYNVL
jgi:protein phosphatase